MPVNFASLTFIVFVFVVFSLYWSARRRTPQNIVLLLASYAFYAWWDYRFLALIALSTIVDFCAGHFVGPTRAPRVRHSALAISVLLNLGLLGFFKYFNFFADSFQSIMVLLGWDPGPMTLRIVLPVGISFFTFQTMSYTIDVYRQTIPPCRNLLDYATYVSFFPQLVAGPIERGATLLPQFQAPRTFEHDSAVDGARQILWGFFKKMVIADNLAVLVDSQYADPTQSSGILLIAATIAFAFQIYCDFSGYSDIAIGLGRWFGIRLSRNFAYPYFSQSLPEFWRRWHISLSTWFRDYLYIPLGGNRRSARWTRLNIMATFIVSGLWHGAAWTFVVWGTVHGLALLVDRGVVYRGPLPRTPISSNEPNRPDVATLMRIARTFTIVCLAWVLFRATSFQDAMIIYEHIGTGFFSPTAWAEAAELGKSRNIRLAVLVAVLVTVEWRTRRSPHPLCINHWPRWGRWVIYTVLFWVTMNLGTRSNSEFIYFQF